MNKQELIKAARLARLSLSEKEQSEFVEQLQVIFDYFKQISSINTENILPLVYPLEGVKPLTSLREDDIQITSEENKKEELLNLAPERLGNEYKVPPVVD